MNTQTTRSLDHFVICVSDIEISAEMYRRLGFRVLPTMEHTHIGTSNTVIQFHDTYLELIGDLHLANSDQLRKDMERWLSQGDVYWQTAMTSKCLEEDIPVIAATGLEMQPILHAGRHVRKAHGGWDMTDSRSAYIWNPDDKLASVFISDHRKPEAIWMPPYQNHPNTCIRVGGFRYIMTDPGKHAGYFSKVAGGAPTSQTADCVRFETPRGEFLELMTPEALHAAYPEAPQLSPGTQTRGAIFTIIVESLERCRWTLRDGGVPHRMTEASIVVGAPFGCGVAYEFVEGK